MSAANNRFSHLLVFALSLLAAPASAFSDKGEFAVKGLGADRCGNFIEAAEKKVASVAEFRGWVEGYLTAVNRYRPDTFDIVPWQSSGMLLSLIRAHCEQHRDDRLFEVVHQLQLLLAQDRMVARSEVVEIGEGGQKLRLYSEVLKRVQQALIERKLLDGKADGAFGPKTRAALEAFQKQLGIPATGLPDQQTLFELLLRPRLKG